MSAPVQKPQAVPRANRMTLQAVTRGVRRRPFRELIHGVDKVGKTTWAAGAPSPIFLCAEDGSDNLDVARFPTPESFEDCRDAVRTLTDDPGGYETLVIDSADWMESLVYRAVCEEAKVKSIEDVGGGYGKGYVAAVDKWRAFLADLERLQTTRGTHIILIVHSHIKPFKNPEGEPFDRYTLKMYDKSAALLREWCQGVYFANYETFAVTEKSKRVRGVSTGARLLYTQRTAAYDAGNRYNLPESIPLDWASFVAAVEAGQSAPPTALLEEILRKAEELGGDTGAKAADAARNNPDPIYLARVNDRLNALLAQRAEEKGE